MSLCDSCARLLLAPIRNDVPIQLQSSDPATLRKGEATREFRTFDCVHCDARWGWREITGWFLDTTRRSAAEDDDAPST